MIVLTPTITLTTRLGLLQMLEGCVHRARGVLRGLASPERREFGVQRRLLQRLRH